MEKKKIVVVHFPRSIFDRFLASIFYAAAVYWLYLFCSKVNPSFSEDFYIAIIKFFSLFILILGFAIRFSASETHHFDFENMKHRTFLSAGPIGFGKWKKLKKLSRVSTFFNAREEYEVNVWDIKNKRYKIANFYEEKDAVLYGRDLAESLEVRFKERN